MFHPLLSKVNYHGKFELAKRDDDEGFAGSLTTVEDGEQIERFFRLFPFLPDIKSDAKRCDFELLKAGHCPSCDLFWGEALFSPDRSLIYMVVSTDRCYFVGSCTVPQFC